MRETPPALLVPQGLDRIEPGGPLNRPWCGRFASAVWPQSPISFMNLRMTGSASRYSRAISRAQRE